jgi:hypothetical protein
MKVLAVIFPYPPSSHIRSTRKGNPYSARTLSETRSGLPEFSAMRNSPIFLANANIPEQAISHLIVRALIFAAACQNQMQMENE